MTTISQCSQCRYAKCSVAALIFGFLDLLFAGDEAYFRYDEAQEKETDAPGGRSPPVAE
jgi:hypothetical protein